MGDTYNEQLVKANATTKDTAIKAGSVIAAFFVTVAAFAAVPELLPVAVILSVFGLYRVFLMTNREFEYILTGGELDIDCIYGKSRRKRKFSCDMRDVIVMAHASDTGYEKEMLSAAATLRFGAGACGKDTYFLLAPYKSKRVKIVFDPNEKMVRAMRPYLGAGRLVYPQI